MFEPSQFLIEYNYGSSYHKISDETPLTSISTPGIQKQDKKHFNAQICANNFGDPIGCSFSIEARPNSDSTDCTQKQVKDTGFFPQSSDSDCIISHQYNDMKQLKNVNFGFQKLSNTRELKNVSYEELVRAVKIPRQAKTRQQLRPAPYPSPASPNTVNSGSGFTETIESQLHSPINMNIQAELSKTTESNQLEILNVTNDEFQSSKTTDSQFKLIKNADTQIQLPNIIDCQFILPQKTCQPRKRQPLPRELVLNSRTPCLPQNLKTRRRLLKSRIFSNAVSHSHFEICSSNSTGAAGFPQHVEMWPIDPALKGASVATNSPSIDIPIVGINS